ncbi:hypothetical protein [Bradyrhizobium sp. LB11.1]|uniref:hypothetical protein n=1 Tax=Bradyrhizobium sp. LB11.1 TaxID=3156326 RepID=UPI00339AEEDA
MSVDVRTLADSTIATILAYWSTNFTIGLLIGCSLAFKSGAVNAKSSSLSFWSCICERNAREMEIG